MRRAKLFDRIWILIRHGSPVEDVNVAVLAGGADVEVVGRVRVHAVQRHGSGGVAH